MTSYTFRRPAMYLNASEIAAVKGRLGRQPWARAYDRLLDSAAVAMRRAPDPVRGDYAPADRPRLFRDCSAVRDLGLTFALTGEEPYARKAAACLLTWSGAMSPRFPSPSSVPDLCAALAAMFYGVDLIWRSRGFTGEDKARLAAWADGLACDLKERSPAPCDPAAGWALTFFAASALVVEDPAWFDLAFDGFRPVLAAQIEPDGTVSRQQGRDEGLRDSLLTLKALTCVAEIARHQGIDLYNAGVDGRSLKAACLRHAPFLLRDEAWPGAERVVGESHAELYEIAFRVWGEAAFAEVLRRRGRNAWDGRILGPVVLTHGAELNG
ncbi:MAG: hypothetical protein A3F84_07435 [Candidatus Handelsmanbacteria bacterium RIFCSPLOWO2_12_FULL_64_10]|uniref:Alginate lyase domain-containing protein n=1 Tax=Handelsmanbacteria sp. (strain RIFCSPLOWO2_12_FULL_64_10) TaxID=1817868 RepID=A0A1F6CCF4_HANXR|nr:MAG: hypothetical protein A3F84_07435 [Candidatus Handelsmanbacteria bacterium RIFCSPLOWO2_12_FULL_64_10]